MSEFLHFCEHTLQEVALVFMGPQIDAGAKLDLEVVLPVVIRDFLPIGLAGLMIAGLLSAFMSTFAGTVNAATAVMRHP